MILRINSDIFKFLYSIFFIEDLSIQIIQAWLFSYLRYGKWASVPLFLLSGLKLFAVIQWRSATIPEYIMINIKLWKHLILKRKLFLLFLIF
jgi:hypothetical protein